MPLITGTAGRDTLRGTAGRDTINALGGNDTIHPGRGPDRVDAGNGADVVHWNQESTSRNVVDTYIGGQQQEYYDPNPYFARSGGDRLILGQAAGQNGFRVNFSSTEDGHALDAWGNRLNFTQFERLETGSGNDVITAAGASIRPARGNPNDPANYVPQHGIDVMAGAGNDYIVGSRHNDFIDGGSGNDTIYGGDGWDFIQSSTGNDLIYGEGGNDNIRWGQGNPAERVGNDTIYGGERGEQGGDLLNIWIRDWDGTGVSVNFHTNEGGIATTTIGGGQSTLRFYQFENFFTHEGNDTVSAANATPGAGNRGINFNTRWGNDLLTGSRGNDTLEGGEGADTIDGGRGNDFISLVESAYLSLGSQVQPDAQRDVLVVHDGAGFDTIRGFQVGDVRNSSGNIIRRGDQLDLKGLRDAQGNLVDINDVRVTENNGHAALSFPNGERLMLENVRAAGLTRAQLVQMGIRNANAQRLAAEAQSEPPDAGASVRDTPDTTKAQGKYAQTDAMGVASRQGGPVNVTCFCAGTLIATPTGEVAVERLRAGDLVVTHDHGPQPLRWVGRRVLDADALRQAPDLRPIMIRAGSLGQGVPQRDLAVSPQQRVLVRSTIAQRMFGATEVLAAAKQLLALQGITQPDTVHADYVHILFDDHQLVTSNGAPTESLYTGTEALAALGRAAQEEIFAIFPDLRDTPPAAARPMVPGARARQLAQRHLRPCKALVT